MTRRQAKRRACWTCGLLLRGDLEGLLSGYVPTKEEERVHRAIAELISELEHRGHYGRVSEETGRC